MTVQVNPEQRRHVLSFGRQADQHVLTPALVGYLRCQAVEVAAGVTRVLSHLVLVPAPSQEELTELPVPQLVELVYELQQTLERLAESTCHGPWLAFARALIGQASELFEHALSNLQRLYYIPPASAECAHCLSETRRLLLRLDLALDRFINHCKGYSTPATEEVGEVASRAR